MRAGAKALVLSALLALAAPASGIAQDSPTSTAPYRLRVGASLGFPADLYEGFIDFRGSRDGEEIGRFRTVYRERLGAQGELRAGLDVPLSRSLLLSVEGRLGRASSTASFEGDGAGRETLRREVTWGAADLLLGVRPAALGPLSARLYAGPSIGRYHLDTGGRGRDRIADLAAGLPGASQPGSIEWSSPSWFDLDFVLGARADLRVLPGFDLTAAVEQRILRNDGGGIEDALARDVERAVGEDPLASVAGSTTTGAVLSLGVQWRFAAGDRTPDVREAEAIAAVRSAGRRYAAAGLPLATLPSDAAEALAEGDTMRAIRALEAAVRERPDRPAGWGALGILLAHAAPTKETDFAARLRSREALDRALELDPGNPRYLVAYGVLLEKQAVPVDARRVLGRALAAAAERPGDVTPGELAEAFYRRARARERHVLEFRDLRHTGTGDPPVTTPACAGLGAFCLNWVHPRRFYEWSAGLGEISGTAAEAREMMLADYRRAVALAPGHSGASRHLLAWLARDREWEAFLRRARSFAEASADPWARVFLAVGRYESGDREEAARLFEVAVDSLPSRDRGIFRDLSPMLGRDGRVAWSTMTPEERRAYAGLYWRKSDLLYITRENEREIEHYARVALAELLFGEVRSGRRGWETPRGDILVRYGLPRDRWQIRRDARLIMEQEEWDALEGFRECTEDRMSGACDLGMALVATNPAAGGGRWIFWNYDPDEPSFIFDRDLGSLTVDHMPESYSRIASEEARELRPATFDPPFRRVSPLDYQLVRFRGSEPGTHELVIHAAAPVDELGVASADSLIQGIHLFHGEEHREVVGQTATTPAGPGWLDYRVEAPPGLYSYSLEVMTRDGDAASVARDRVALGTYAPTTLRISDLLMARSVEAVTEPAVRTHRDLEYDPLRCPAIPRNRVVGVVFEIYELAVEDGRGRYRVTVESGEEDAGGLVARALRSVRDLFRDEEAGTLSFEREVELEPGERTAEWFVVEIPEEAGDEVELGVTVTDIRTGESTVAKRSLGGEGCRR